MLGRSASPNGDSGSGGPSCPNRTTGNGRSSSSSRLPGALSLGDATEPKVTAVRAGAARAGAETAAGRSRSPKSRSADGICPCGCRGSIGAGKSTSRAACPEGVTTAGRSDSSGRGGDATRAGRAGGGGGAGGGGNGGRTTTGGGGRRRGGGGGPPRGRPICSRSSPGSASNAIGGAMPSIVALFGCCDGMGRAPSAAPLGRSSSVGGST
jgi:hypothetical protein